MVGPIGNTPTTPTANESTTSTATSTTTTQDTITSSNIDPRVDGDAAFMKIISDAEQVLKEEIYNAQRGDLEAAKRVTRKLAEGLAVLNNAYNTAYAAYLSATWGVSENGNNGIVSLTQQLNAAAQAYSDAVQNLKNGLNDYNTEVNVFNTRPNGGQETNQKIANGTITANDVDAYNGSPREDFSNATNAFNALIQAVDQAKDTYDTALSAYNAKIDTLNQEITAENVKRQASGLTPIPLKEKATAISFSYPTAQPLPPTLSTNPLPTTPITLPSTLTIGDFPIKFLLTDPSTITQEQFLGDVTTGLAAMVRSADDQGLGIFLGADLVPLLLPGHRITLPTSYSLDNYDLTETPGGIGLGGAGLAGLVLGLSNDNVESILGQDILEKSLEDENLQGTNTPANGLFDLVTLLAINAGNLSVATSLNLLRAAAKDTGDGTIRNAVGIGASLQALDLLRSGGLAEQVSKVLETLPGIESLTPEARAQLTNKVNGILNASFARLLIGNLYGQTGLGSLLNIFSNALFLGGVPGTQGAVKQQNQDFKELAARNPELGGLLAGFLRLRLDQEGVKPNQADLIATRASQGVDEEYLNSLEQLKKFFKKLLTSLNAGGVDAGQIAGNLLEFQAAALARNELSTGRLAEGSETDKTLKDALLQAAFGVNPDVESGHNRFDKLVGSASLSSVYEESVSQVVGTGSDPTKKVGNLSQSTELVLEFSKYIEKIMDPGFEITKRGFGIMNEAGEDEAIKKQPMRYSV